MKTSPVTTDDLSASVIAVPPFARRADLSPNFEENAKLLRHLEANGIRTVLYAGNANAYHARVSEYAAGLEWMVKTAAADTWIIPSAGTDFGRLMDQAKMLNDFPFPAVLVLPESDMTTPAGVETAVRKFSERIARPVLVYLKSEGYLTPEGLGRLVADGIVCGAKYAVNRKDPAQDDFLRRLLDSVDRRFVAGGLGERPTVVHVRDFGLNGFTSGSVCLAPRTAAQLLNALKAGDFERAEGLRGIMLPMEDLRDTWGATRVLHDAVTLAGLADMGPILPMLHNLEAEHQPAVAQAATALVNQDRRR